jgi:septal ring factor EnvC (AmiA/AmiB activator)
MASNQSDLLDEMKMEGSRLAHELHLADNHIDVLEKENKKLKEVIQSLKNELAVALAERDQADAKNNEYKEFDAWRDQKFAYFQFELNKLRDENISLREGLKANTSSVSEQS